MPDAQPDRGAGVALDEGLLEGLEAPGQRPGCEHRGGGEGSAGCQLDGGACSGAAVKIDADEAGHVLGARTLRDLGGGALLHDAFTFEDQQPVGERYRVQRVVGDQYGGSRVIGQVVT